VTSYWTKADARPNQNCSNLVVGWFTVHIKGHDNRRWENKLRIAGAACLQTVTFL
jgi:hypothetical protein